MKQFLRLIAYVSSAIMLLFCQACHTIEHYSVDERNDQPLVGDRGPAIGHLSQKIRGVGLVVWLDWTDEAGIAIADSRTLIDKCEKYLKQHNALEETEQLTITNKRFLHPFVGPGEYVGYRHVKIIVCLDPAIVVVAPGPIMHLDTAMTRQGGLKVNRDTIFLPYGYAYGVSIPYADSINWFSPELKVGPLPTDPLPDGRRRIPVPWGFLVMTRFGDNWIITAERK
jgi:hypothetical protein